VFLFGLVALLLKNTFSSRLGIGHGTIELPRLAAMTVLWLALSTPITACRLAVRHFASSPWQKYLFLAFGCYWQV
jgi:hypothetical protein